MQRRPKVFYWALGTATALAGVAVARLLAPQLTGSYQSLTFYLGAAIAIAGIFVFALGSKRNGLQK